jgi:tetratricopeptide (TPR) repeat protein
VRLGIASGLVVVSHVLAPDKSAVGETPNLAQRMQTLAQPGQVMVSDRTRALAGGAFDYQDEGLHSLKGIAAPTPVWRVLGPSGAASRFEAATRGAVTPMVGREQEVALLLDRWELARGAEGQVMLLQGEPGIGKSRMLGAFRERLGRRVEMALQYQCSPYYTNSAFYPIAEHIERALQFDRTDSAEAKLDKIEQYLSQALSADAPADAARIQMHASLLARMLSIACDARYGPLGLTPQRQKDDTIGLLVDLVAQVASQYATVVLFEDVHWADPTTLEVLSALIDRTEKLPLLVLITYRPEFTPPWTSRTHATPLVLTRLSRAQGASVALRVAGKPLPSELVDQIVDKTDGVPLFLEELTKAVLESSIVLDAGDRYDYSSRFERLAIPSTLRDSLMARLDRLMPVKQIAQIGACLGREFSHELVQAVSPMSPAQLDEALQKLVSSELVFRRGAPPEATYIFKHALVQDAAYDSILKSKRQALHAQIAEAIRERLPSKAATEPELLAHHYGEAGMLSEALTYWQKAGELAQTRFALREAVNSYGQAVRLLATLEQSPENMRRHVDIAVKWADLIVPSQEIIAALETAECYAEKLGDRHRIGTVKSYLGQLLFYLGRSESAARHLQRVIEMADRMPERDRVGSAYRCLGQLYLFSYSRYSDALQCIEQAMPIVQATGNRFEESCCFGLLGLEYGFRGRFEQSFAAFDSAVHAARAGQEHSIESWNLMWRSQIHALKGEWAAAASHAQEGLALARKIQNLWAVDWCTLMSCYAQFMDTPDASLLQPAIQAAEHQSGTTCVSIAFCYVADMLHASGDLDAADDYAERAISQIKYGSYFCALLHIPLIKSMVAAARCDPDWRSAARGMEEAIAIAREHERTPHLAVCHLRRAALLCRQGERAEARSSLEQAESLFANLGMAWWLGAARRLRAEMQLAESSA